MPQKILIIMSGISGSGKSYQAKLIASDYEQQGLGVAICSTDDYWYVVNGDDKTKYDFDPSKIGVAHKWNQDKAKHFLQLDDCDVVIIDNTNLKQWEIEPYLKMGKEVGAEIRNVSVNVPVEVAKKYNSLRSDDRKVPDEVIDRQYAGRELLKMD
jgi:predicted kinase